MYIVRVTIKSKNGVSNPKTEVFRTPDDSTGVNGVVSAPKLLQILRKQAEEEKQAAASTGKSSPQATKVSSSSSKDAEKENAKKDSGKKKDAKQEKQSPAVVVLPRPGQPQELRPSKSAKPERQQLQEDVAATERELPMLVLMDQSQVETLDFL